MCRGVACAIADQLRYLAETVEKIRRLACSMRDKGIAAELNALALRSSKSKVFTTTMISWVSYRNWFGADLTCGLRGTGLSIYELLPLFGGTVGTMSHGDISSDIDRRYHNIDIIRGVVELHWGPQDDRLLYYRQTSLTGGWIPIGMCLRSMWCVIWPSSNSDSIAAIIWRACCRVSAVSAWVHRPCLQVAETGGDICVIKKNIVRGSTYTLKHKCEEYRTIGRYRH